VDLAERSISFLHKKSIDSVIEIRQLQEIIREHNRLYYLNESPIISDKEYDDLFKLLKYSEEKLNVFDPDSPTKRVDVLVSNQFQK